MVETPPPPPPIAAPRDVRDLIEKIPRGSDAGSGHGARRDSQRFVLNQPVRIGAPDPTAPLIEGWTLNISARGVRVITEAPLRVGSCVPIEIGIGRTGDRAAFRGQGRVVWARPRADGTIAGIEFVVE